MKTLRGKIEKFIAKNFRKGIVVFQPNAFQVNFIMRPHLRQVQFHAEHENKGRLPIHVVGAKMIFANGMLLQDKINPVTIWPDDSVKFTFTLNMHPEVDVYTSIQNKVESLHVRKNAYK